MQPWIAQYWNLEICLTWILWIHNVANCFFWLFHRFQILIFELCVWSRLKVPTQYGSLNASKFLDLILREIEVAEKALIFTLYWELSSSNSHLNFQSKTFVCNSIPFFKARMAKKAVFSSFLIHRIRISYMHRHQIVYFIFHDMTRITALVLSSRESVLFPTLGLLQNKST